MIIANLNVVRVTILPDEADPPLVVDPYAVLTFPTSFQLFEAITREDPQVGQGGSSVDLLDFSQRCTLNIRGELP